MLSRTARLPDKAGPPPAAYTGIRRQRGEIADEPLLVETAVAAWEGEGGAQGRPPSGAANAELSAEDLEFKEVLV